MKRPLLLLALAAIVPACAADPVDAEEAEASAAVSTGGKPLVGIAGKCLDVFGGSTANGATVGIYGCHGSAWQQWTLTENTLVGVGGKCLDVAGAGTANGTIVQLYACNGSPAQVWSYTGGELVNPRSGKCLDVKDFSSADGATVQIWDCHGGANQLWSFGSAVPTPPTPPAPPPGSTLPSITTFIAGTNLSAMEFNSGKKPGKAFFDYGVPTHAEVDYFVGKGMRFIRLPFLWERVQPALDGPLDAAYLGHITDLVTYITSKGAYALLDPHNYARYNGVVIGSATAGAPTATQFGSFWATLAKVFSSNPKVVFGLMNEPEGIDGALWLADANTAIAAIRAAGARNVITVPGNNWTGAHSWVGGASSNGTVMLGVHDPLDNYIYEVHQYLDSDSSGTHEACVSSTAGSQALKSFTEWLHTNHKRAMLGEFGVANNATCLAGLDDMLAYMGKNEDVWAGYTYWSAGPWWGSYMYSIEPKNGVDAPQMTVLLKHL
ncbi:MAG: hypothetical protein JWP97_5240 [Labilithrix sp.]|nr:hypothetical protein [Labilithrix sp.]